MGSLDFAHSLGKICVCDDMEIKNFQFTSNLYIVLSYQLKLIKLRAKFADLNHCGVPILSRAAVNLCRYD